MTHHIRYAITAALLTATVPLGAQLPNTSASATGLAGNYTALARGYEAITWNPALLAAPGRPGFSIGVLLAGGASGLDPIDVSDLADYEGRVIPATVKSQWVEQVRAAGQQRGDADGGITPIALSVGNFGLQYSVTAYANASLNDDATEALLFGNAGATGEPRNFNFAGSEVDGGAVSTIAASYAFRLPAAVGRHLSLGVTGKYIFGHVVARGQDAGSTTTADEIDIVFPVVHTREDETTSGGGIGLDVGAAFTAGRLRVGASIANVINTFAWDEAKLVFRPGTAHFDADSSSSDFDTTAFASAPAALREAIADQSFRPRASVGVAIDVSRLLTVTGDLRSEIGDGIVIGAKDHIGVGAELRVIPFLPLRAGVAKITDGTQFAGGVGLRIGRYELGVGATLRNRSEGKATGITINAITVR